MGIFSKKKKAQSSPDTASVEPGSGDAELLRDGALLEDINRLNDELESSIKKSRVRMRPPNVLIFALVGFIAFNAYCFIVVGSNMLYEKNEPIYGSWEAVAYYQSDQDEPSYYYAYNELVLVIKYDTNSVSDECFICRSGKRTKSHCFGFFAECLEGFCSATQVYGFRDEGGGSRTFAVCEGTNEEGKDVAVLFDQDEEGYTTFVKR